MKWNIEYECTENEFVNWTNVFGSIINKMIDAKTLRRATIKAANAFTDELSDDLPTAKPMPFVVDGGLDEDSEESFHRRTYTRTHLSRSELNESSTKGKNGVDRDS